MLDKKNNMLDKKKIKVNIKLLHSTFLFFGMLILVFITLFIFGCKAPPNQLRGMDNNTGDYLHTHKSTNIIFTNLGSCEENMPKFGMRQHLVKIEGGVIAIKGHITINCCSDDIIFEEVKVPSTTTQPTKPSKPSKIGDIIVKVKEMDYDGKLCKCFCFKNFEMLINNSHKFDRVVIIKESNYSGRIVEQKVIINQTYDQIPEFCGLSKGVCNSDKDCVVGGCSGQLCYSTKDYKKLGLVTTCEWKECYDADKYGLTCRCINNKCMWA